MTLTETESHRLRHVQAKHHTAEQYFAAHALTSTEVEARAFNEEALFLLSVISKLRAET